ncbi:MAG: L-fuculose-phosphate aldolase [Halanaerobiaceae bacterium]
MFMEKEREQVRKYGRRLIETDLTTGTGGNISVYNREQELMAIKPTGMEYMKIKTEDIPIMDLDGNKIEGSKSPSSEYEMHRIFYRKREGIGAVVHTHSIYSTTISCLNREIPPVHYLVAFSGEKVPCAEYATFGTEELAEEAYEAMKDKYNATLLANHGLLAVGKDIASAFATAEEIEFCAELYYRTLTAGEPVLLSQEDMETVSKKFETYGQ